MKGEIAEVTACAEMKFKNTVVPIAEIEKSSLAIGVKADDAQQTEFRLMEAI
jgi:hypothetical protein